MTGYEKMLAVMKRQGKKNDGSDLKIAVVGENLSISLSGLTLLKEDLIFSKTLLTGYKDKNGNTVPPISEGAAVLVKRISDEKYIVICEAVSADA